MTSKEQERKALEQIKKIVAGLGENSYIATAFEGCFEIAAENIENDFACSMKQRVNSRDEEIKGLMKSIKSYEEKVAQQQKTIAEDNAVIERHAKYIDELEAKIAGMQNTSKQMEEALKRENDDAIQNWNKYREQEDKVAELEEQIIHLKAKLYDLLTK